MISQIFKIAFLSNMNLNLSRFPLLIELANRNWEVFAITPEGKYSSNYPEYGIKHISYNIERRSFNPFLELKTILEIYRILKTFKPTILHTFNIKPNIYGAIAGKLAQVPIIINTITGLGSFYVENNLKTKFVRRLINIFYRLILHFSDYIIFQNFDDLKYFHKNSLVKKKKATVIKGWGIDTRHFSLDSIQLETSKRLRKELNLSKKTIILMIARLIKHKGVLEYCRAAQIIKSYYEGTIEFLLVGDFDKGNPFCIEKNKLYYFIQNNIIKFLGRRDDIKELIALCDVFVLPSYYREGIPRTLIEAASMGKPIITTNAVGCKEVVEHGRNGFLIPRKDSDSLAEALEILIKNKKLREKFGKYSRQKAIKKFDKNIIIEKTINLYKKLLQKKEDFLGFKSIL